MPVASACELETTDLLCSLLDQPIVYHMYQSGCLDSGLGFIFLSVIQEDATIADRNSGSCLQFSDNFSMHDA